MSQPYRLPEGGAVDRCALLAFTFNGRTYEGFAGDTLASALLANGVRLVGRSFKYHRPRGIVGIGAEEPNALVRLGDGDRAEPNVRATTVELHDGLAARSQNHFPSLERDLGALGDVLSRVLPAGFYYKTFMSPPSFWMTYERVIRKAAGLGKPPDAPDPDRYDKRYAHAEVVVVGGGPAGIAAALAAADAGARVILVEENAELGGSLLHTPAEIDGVPATAWLRDAVDALRRRENVTLLTRATATGYYDHELIAAVERVADNLPSAPSGQPRQRLWKIRAKQVVLATGAIERPLVFADNDRPGIMLASAVRGYLHRYGVLCGRNAVVFTNNDGAYATAIDLVKAGAEAATVIDLRRDPDGALLRAAEAVGIRVIAGAAIVGTHGRHGVAAIDWARLDGAGLGAKGGRLDCDLVAMSGGWSPTVHLFSQARGRLRFDEHPAAFVPDTPGGANRSAGACNGRFDLAGSIAEGRAAGAAAARDAGCAVTALSAPPSPAPSWAILPVWAVPAWRGAKSFVDFQNDVTAADIGLAAAEGYRSVEHLKRYTTLGMGTDQGKLSNVNGLAILAGKLGKPIGEVGTTTFRPPYTPVSLGAMIGRDAEDLAHPIRYLATHRWHERHGAVFVPPSPWLRPQFYRRAGESDLDAVNREVLAVRGNVGVVDVSTLGKIDLQGPDAAELLDRLYVNGWKTLGIGRGRYGVMLREDGMVFDDGVTMRLGEHHFVMSTTTVNIQAVREHIDFLLQTRWRELRVFATPVTEQWYSAALAGPNARRVLARLKPDFEIGNEAFPHMSAREGQVAGIPARVFRMSFSGELSYEINVPADRGLALWEAVVAEGAPLGLTVYGTEAMGVLRIEKGHVVVGREADGRTTPDDLGLGRMVSRKKEFIGKRSLSLPALAAPDRRQLVGLVVEAASDRIPVGAHVVAEYRPEAQPSLGYVTSQCFSPTLGRSIALALVKGGRARIGKSLYATSPVLGETVRVRLTSPIFVDPEGKRLDV